MKKYILLCSLLSLVLGSNAQHLNWASTLGSKSGDQTKQVVVGPQGSIYSIGRYADTAYISSGSAGPILPHQYNDFFIQKMDASGNLVWVKGMGSNKQDDALCIAVDDTGNVYITGYYQDTLDCDPGSGVYNLTPTIFSGLDAFLIKLDPNGNFLWANKLGGTEYENGDFVGVDSFGFVYMAGYTFGTMDMDPGPGTANITTAGNNDIFIIKFNAAGKYIWGKRMGGTGVDIPQAGYIDKAGNIYTTGYFQSSVDFNPGAASYSLTASGQEDVFISKLDSGGNFVLARSMGGTLKDYGYGIHVDITGNIYTTGYFQGTADFLPGTGSYNLVSAGGQDVFVSKLSNQGNFVWAKRIGASGNDIGYCTKMDAVQHVYCTGSFTGKVDFNTGSDSLFFTTPNTNTDGFVLELDSAGNFVTANQLGNKGNELIFTVWPISSGNFYLGGYFSDTTDLDMTAGVYSRITKGNTDAFLAKYSSCSNSSSSFSQSACVSYTAPDGKVYASSGNVTAIIPNSTGCDSIISIQLTINTVDTSVTQAGQTLTASATGAQYQWVNCANNYAPISGATSNVFTTPVPGTYAVVVTINGCRDTSSCYTIVCNNSSSSISPVACFAYTAPNGMVYTNSGLYNVTIPNSFGCDSNITINLTVNSVNNGITLNQQTLTATANGAQYQWVDCNNNYGPIANATAKQFTPLATGSYAVIVKANGCTDTSYCEGVVISNTSINETTLLNKLEVYPNPVSTSVSIHLPQGLFTVTIYDNQGKAVKTIRSAQGTMVVDLNGLANGVYLINAINDSYVMKATVLKH